MKGFAGSRRDLVSCCRLQPGMLGTRGTTIYAEHHWIAV